MIAQIGASVPVSKEDATLSRRELTAAGFRSEKALGVYYAIKFAFSVVALSAALFLVPHATQRILLRIVLYIGAAALGYFAPNLALDAMVSARQRRLRIGLPDALDLMVIAVESGMGMDQAFVSVTRELRNAHKDVTEEFSLATLEMRAGKRRVEALHNLAVRTGEPEVRKLVAVLAQTDRFGTSIADALRTHADFMRVTRRLTAEEKAGKLGVKLIFPIFFFILPAMALVVAGPGVLQVVRVLLPALRSAR
jgi:tight adherence protein C